MDIEQFKKELKAAGTSYTIVKNRTKLCNKMELLEVIDCRQTAADILQGLFIWADTKEGHKYWSNIWKQLRSTKESGHVY